jgi:hypothetical protein
MKNEQTLIPAQMLDQIGHISGSHLVDEPFQRRIIFLIDEALNLIKEFIVDYPILKNGQN